MIFHYLSSNSDLCDGIGQLLFELSRGVPLQFHSSCRSVLSSVLKMLGCPDLHCDRVFVSVTKMLELMAEHTRKEFSEPVWRSLLVRRLWVCLHVEQPISEFYLHFGEEIGSVN